MAASLRRSCRAPFPIPPRLLLVRDYQRPAERCPDRF